MASTSLKKKSHGNRYSPQERARALRLYEEIGPSAAARKTGIPYETLRRWSRDAGIEDSRPPAEVAARAHATASVRVAGKWADFREEEALAAGAAAEVARERLLEVIDTDDSQMLRALTDAYDKLITNAERLSGQATERISVWAKTDLDKELRTLVAQVEDRVRGEIPALPTPEDQERDKIEDVEVEVEP